MLEEMLTIFNENKYRVSKNTEPHKILLLIFKGNKMLKIIYLAGKMVDFVCVLPFSELAVQ
jgi:hypothetical protein